MTAEKWEPVTDNGDGTMLTLRLKVPGGWIYEVREYSQAGSGAYPEIKSRALCFVPNAAQPSDVEVEAIVPIIHEITRTIPLDGSDVSAAKRILAAAAKARGDG